MPPEWTPWAPSATPAKQIYLLRRSSNDSEIEEGDSAFARVYEYAEQTPEPRKTNAVLRFVLTEDGNFFAEELTTDDFSFVNAHENHGWAFLPYDLTDPTMLEKIMQSFEAMRLRNDPWQYVFYEQLTRVVLTRQPNPNFITVPTEMPIVMPAIPTWNICHITGQPHHFIENKPSITIIGNPYGSTCWRLCKDCHHPVYTAKLPGE